MCSISSGLPSRPQVALSTLPAESGGVCTFCGNQVALRYHDGSAVQPAAAASSSSQCSHEGQHQQQHETTSGTSTVIGGSKAGPPTGPSQGQAERQVSEAEAAALELKNRLVEYDRNSAKRTTVIDDQSDFFEIDSNAWLTAEVSSCCQGPLCPGHQGEGHRCQAWRWRAGLPTLRGDAADGASMPATCHPWHRCSHIRHVCEPVSHQALSRPSTRCPCPAGAHPAEAAPAGDGCS